MEVDIAVIGAGIAGASLASEVAPHRKVVVLEQEDQPGRHATGRSAAVFAASYGNAAVRALTAASRAFLEAPPEGFAGHPLLSERGVLLFGRADQAAALDAQYETARATGVRAERLDAAGAARVAPVFREAWGLAGAVFEPDSAEIDVHGLLSGYARLARARGAAFLTDARVLDAQRAGGRWRLGTAAGPVWAEVVVDAAGAWADEVAGLFGAAAVGLVPCRRTGLVVDAPGWPLERLPFCVDIGETLYFKPDGGRLLVSPGDETPGPPADIAADEMDIAIAVDRLTTATEIEVRRVAASWAGYRTFAPDRSLVVGFDPNVDGLFWLAGQGGYGVQTAPAAARLAASLLGLDKGPDIDPAPFSPGRFATTVANATV